jgi:hypothetical protein
MEIVKQTAQIAEPSIRLNALLLVNLFDIRTYRYGRFMQDIVYEVVA